MPNEHSLSWYKKRTAALNKALGTKYSPTQIYRAEQYGGFDTEVGAQLEALGDPRSKGSAEVIESAAGELVRIQWSTLAANNAYVYHVSTSVGGYISADGRTVYDRLPSGDWEAVDIRTGNAFPVDQPPKGSIFLSPKTANDLLKAKAQNLKPFKNRKGESINNYLYQ